MQNYKINKIYDVYLSILCFKFYKLVHLIYLNPHEIQSHLSNAFNSLCHNYLAINCEANPQTDTSIQFNSICRLTGKKTGRIWLNDAGHSKSSQLTRSEHFKALRQQYLSNHETSVRTGWRTGLSLWCWKCVEQTVCTQALWKAKSDIVVKKPTQQSNQAHKLIFIGHESASKEVHRTVNRQVHS